MSSRIHNPLILLEASTGIEPVFTDLQSAASPLRQLATEASDISSCGGSQGIVCEDQPLLPLSLCGIVSQRF